MLGEVRQGRVRRLFATAPIPPDGPRACAYGFRHPRGGPEDERARRRRGDQPRARAAPVRRLRAGPGGAEAGGTPQGLPPRAAERDGQLHDPADDARDSLDQRRRAHRGVGPAAQARIGDLHRALGSFRARPDAGRRPGLQRRAGQRLGRGRAARGGQGLRAAEDGAEALGAVHRDHRRGAWPAGREVLRGAPAASARAHARGAECGRDQRARPDARRRRDRLRPLDAGRPAGRAGARARPRRHRRPAARAGPLLPLGSQGVRRCRRAGAVDAAWQRLHRPARGLRPPPGGRLPREPLPQGQRRGRPDWDLSGAVEDYRLLFRLGHDIAQGEHWPQWRPGDESAAPREEMLGRALRP